MAEPTFAEITIDGSLVTDETGPRGDKERDVRVADVLRKIDEAEAAGRRVVLLAVNSLGGIVQAEYALYARLRAFARSGGRSVAYVHRTAASSAAKYILGADYVVANGRATLHYHGLIITGPPSPADDALRRGHDEVTGALLAAHSLMGDRLLATWKRLWSLGEVTSLCAREARDLGIVDEIGGREAARRIAERLARGEDVATPRRAALADRPRPPVVEEILGYLHAAGTNLAQTLVNELEAINRKVSIAGEAEARSLVEVQRRAAKMRAAAMVELELRPDKYRRAEAKASRERLEHLLAKRWAEARDAQIRRLWNHFMALETAKAREEVEGIRAYLLGFEDLGKRRRLGKAGQQYVEAIDEILDGMSLRRTTAKAVTRRQRLAKYVAEIEEDGGVISPELRELAGEVKSYREMTLDELRAAKAAVANIDKQARLKGKLMVGKEKRDLARTATELGEHIRGNVGTKAAPTPGDVSGLEAKKEWLRHADAEMKKVEFIARILDGGKTAGLAHRLIFQPLRDAQNARYALQEKVHAALMKPFQELSRERRVRYAGEVAFLYSPKAGKMVTLTRRNVLAVALNLGNEGNRERLLAGYGWTEAEVLARLGALLDDGDVQIINHVWKTVDSLWPAMKDLSERTVGLPPARVEATPFKLVLQAGGTPAEFTGGYYPIVKSRRMSYLGQQIAEREDAMKTWTANFFAPVVEHGFTKGRGKDMSPLELSLDVVPAHLDKVIHYLTHYEPIRSVDKLVQRAEVRTAITEGLGREYYNQLRPWLENIAADGSLSEPLNFYERIFRHLRFGSTVVLLFGKIPTGVKQALGLFTSAKELRRRHVVAGVRRFLREGWGEVRELSPEFKYIDKQLDRDARELFTSLESSFSELGALKRKVAEYGALPIMLVQKSVNAITWYAAREQALEEGHQDPAAYADSVVSMTQTGGGAKDLAAVQRGGELRKLFTVFYSYRSVLYNQLSEQMPGASAGAKARMLAARFWWLVLLPVVTEQLVMNGVPDDEDEDETLKRVSLEMALTTVSTVPFVSDVGRAALTGREASDAPWVATVYRSAVAAGRAAQGEDLRTSDVRALVDLAGATMHLPTAALWNTGFYVDQLLAGELEEPVQDILFRNPSRWE